MTYSFRTNGNFIDFVHTDNTNQAVETMLRSLHNTSRAVSWSFEEDENRISFKVDDISVRSILITEIDFDGTAMNSQDDFETGIEAMFTGYTGGTSYLVYVPVITQSGTDAPTDVKLANTLLVGTWARSNTGVYNVTTTTPYDLEKTTILGMGSFSDIGTSTLVITDGSAIVGYVMYYPFQDGSNLGLAMDVVDNTFSPVDLSTIIGTTKLYLPEVRVYP